MNHDEELWTKTAIQPRRRTRGRPNHSGSLIAAAVLFASGLFALWVLEVAVRFIDRYWNWILGWLLG